MSQNYEDRMTEVYPSLTQSEKRVADFVRENLTVVLRMSLRELKSAANVSEPTIFRFCKSLGFNGFKDFKISTAQQVSSYRSYLHLDDETDSPLQSKIKHTLSNQIKILDDTMRFADYEKIDLVARRILTARRILFYGAGTSSEICHDACRKLTRLGLQVWSYSDFHDAITQIAVLNNQDLVIGITHSGITQETGDVLKVAHLGNIFTVLITAFPNSQMKRFSDVVLRTFAQETVQNRISIASRVGQFAIMDALYTTIFSLLGETIVPMMEQTTKDIMQR